MNQSSKKPPQADYCLITPSAEIKRVFLKSLKTSVIGTNQATSFHRSKIAHTIPITYFKPTISEIPSILILGPSTNLINLTLACQLLIESQNTKFILVGQGFSKNPSFAIGDIIFPTNFQDHPSALQNHLVAQLQTNNSWTLSSLNQFTKGTNFISCPIVSTAISKNNSELINIEFNPVAQICNKYPHVDLAAIFLISRIQEESPTTVLKNSRFKQNLLATTEIILAHQLQTKKPKTKL